MREGVREEVGEGVGEGVGEKDRESFNTENHFKFVE